MQGAATAAMSFPGMRFAFHRLLFHCLGNTCSRWAGSQGRPRWQMLALAVWCWAWHCLGPSCSGGSGSGGGCVAECVGQVHSVPGQPGALPPSPWGPGKLQSISGVSEATGFPRAAKGRRGRRAGHSHEHLPSPGTHTAWVESEHWWSRGGPGGQSS